MASLGAAARGKVHSNATIESMGRIEFAAQNISIVARVAVSITRVCGLDALMAHRDLRHATARWLSAAW